MIKTIAVIVTYGDRFVFLEQVVRAAVKEGVSQVWIVDNASAVESRKQISSLRSELGNVTVFTNEANLGTAGAYSLVLDYAFRLREEIYLWFLDDDNCPRSGCLRALHSAHSLLSEDFARPVLYCYRGNCWRDDLLAVSAGLIKAPVANGFCGFDIASYLGGKLGRKAASPDKSDVRFPIIKVQYGPYGGLFSHVDNLREIGLPKKEFFVYADDHEYTIRFSKLGIKQFLIYSSQIEDLDMSFKDGEDIFSQNVSLFKLFYSFRNTAYFYNSIKTNSYRYRLNRISFFLIICYWGFFKFLKKPAFIYNRIKFLFSAVRLGEKGVFTIVPNSFE
ncbi:glycosyltransferase [Algoriphagus aestuariicola]|uniref:Glycosyltransferase n=1 Tax=Algoriphagus aestuariicola TaxID=1852016 RepID=A0ABS3BLS5_9BACT|nr:glycosyltransferase [Algoriphagus aestuariicola]MBN7799891.1 glycosyltransferase [Algoriphagus aestuariicola]